MFIQDHQLMMHMLLIQLPLDTGDSFTVVTVGKCVLAASFAKPGKN